MIGIRLEGEEIWLEPREWEVWVEDGRIPPDALVLVPGRGWIEASRLDIYRRTAPEGARFPEPPAPSLREILFPRRGLSATEGLILLNLLVSMVLIVALGSRYTLTVRDWTTEWWYAVAGHRAYFYWLFTIFMHAGPEHLGGNMISLLAGAGAVEFVAGKRWTVVVYVLTGVVGMVVSYWGHSGPPLSIGASGAVFGLLGAVVAFLIRRHRAFSLRQRWKSRRIYLPLFVALYLPSLLNADYFGHVGGLVAGLLLGFFLPPHRRLREYMERERRAAEADLPHQTKA